MKYILYSSLLVIALSLISVIYLREDSLSELEETDKVTLQTSTGAEIQEGKERITTIADNLSIPWEIVFLPEGDMLVTERPGMIKRIGKNGVQIPVSGVSRIGEAGLLGMTLHPEFAKNKYLYIYYTTSQEGKLENRVERYTFENDTLSSKKVILSGIPASRFHDGGRIAFGPDGYLYITTGDAQDEKLAQSTDSLAGKILRITSEGEMPTDNPFKNAVYSYGHRNPQGLAWDEDGTLWSTEHGRSGIASGYDELNKIEKGKNYGWPIIQGDESKKGMEVPILHSGPNSTWAPGGLAYLSGNLLFPGLKGEALYRVALGKEKISLQSYFTKEYGRLRAIQVGRDGYIYITTSNTDGRGKPRQNDDKILKIDPLQIIEAK